PKGGLNGIDNGRLAFDQVRIPRTNLLNRYGDVSPDGTYTSPIESPGRRFFTMLGTLVQGRVSLDGSANRASQLALHIAITYASPRRRSAAPTPTQQSWRRASTSPSTRRFPNPPRPTRGPSPTSSCCRPSMTSSRDAGTTPRRGRTWRPWPRP